MDKFLTLVNSKNPFKDEMVEDFEMVTIIDDNGYVPLYKRNFQKEMEAYSALEPDLQSEIKLTQIEKHTLEACVKLSKKFHEQGIALSLTSAHRSLADQEQIFNDLVKEKGLNQASLIAAKPGESEHHLGLAIDLKIAYETEQKPKLSQKVMGAVRKLPVIRSKSILALQKQLINAAPEFGLVQRYPEDKQKITGIPGERWHFRFVGPTHAQAMQAQGLCLEEYISSLNLTQAK